MKRALFIFASILISVVLASAQSIMLAWNPSSRGGVTYTLFVGTNAPDSNWTTYQTWHGITGTNHLISLSDLRSGTNYMTVAAVSSNPTNVVLSDHSNTIIIVRHTAPVLKMEVSIFGSTNLSAWTDTGGRAFAIMPSDESFQFWKLEPRIAATSGSTVPPVAPPAPPDL